jgi:L-alanine-DL-glutamate epimerase-like enolase superfamily enzyme
VKPSRLLVSSYEIPTATPESDGTLDWNATTLVTFELEWDGVHGFGYTYASVAAAAVIEHHLAKVVLAADSSRAAGVFADLGRAVRNIGRDGIAAMAIAAVDMAIWDWRARRANLPLADFIGRARPSIDAYGSGGFTNYTDAQLAEQLRGWAECGLGRVKMKIGRADPGGRARVGRAAIGDAVALFVDANGAFTPYEAIDVAHELRASNVTWFEEPVPEPDLDGLRFVRDHAPRGVPIAVGEYGYERRDFAAILERACVDVLQADATRCGVTGFLEAAALSAARNVPLSSHCAPSIHAHLGCAVDAMVHCEWFFDHARIERMLFDGAPTLEHGALAPSARPGIGIRLRREAAAPYQTFRKELS